METAGMVMLREIGKQIAVRMKTGALTAKTRSGFGGDVTVRNWWIGSDITATTLWRLPEYVFFEHRAQTAMWKLHTRLNSLAPPPTEFTCTVFWKIRIAWLSIRFFASPVDSVTAMTLVRVSFFLASFADS
jgi:hypothetical protein